MNASLLLTALFNGAWQGAALCVLALLAFRLFRRLNATTMFAVWSVLVAIAVLLPVANYAFATKPYVVIERVPAQHVMLRQVQHDMPAQRDTVVLRRAQHDMTPQRDARVRRDAFTLPQVQRDIEAAADYVLRYAPIILALLALIAFARLGILVHDVVRMLLARKRVRSIEAPVPVSDAIGRPFRYAASSDFTSPCVLGFAPALIVIPEDLLSDDDAELTSVVLHEREHVRRFDDVQNVLHRFIGAVAFFCPGVRIALRELALYREQICDDAAINATGDRVSYAMTLTDLAHWAQGRGAPVPSLIFKRKHLLHRLEVLLDSAVSHSLHMNRRFAFAAVAAFILAAVLVLRIQVPVFAQTIVVASPAPVTQNVRVQMRKVHARVEQMHTQVKAMREQVKQLRVQANEMREQMVKIHTEMNKARTTVKPIHVHVHVHAYHPRPYDVATVVPTASFASTTSMVTTAKTVPTVTTVSVNSSDDLLDALNAAGIRNLSVDDLIAIRDHGVTPDLVRSAASYFGRIDAKDLVYLADHGVGPNYIGSLTASGVRGISPHEAADLMDHGVTSQLIAAATAYFRRAEAGDLTTLADHGVTAESIQSFRSVGLTGASVHDLVRLFDNGVDAAYVAKVRRLNPRASIDDIIRLRDAGF